MTPRIGKTPESELNEIAEESYRQITGTKRKSVRDLQTNKEKMDRIRAEIIRLVDAAEIICREVHKGEPRCPIGSGCPFHAALKKNRPFGCEVSGCIQVLGMPFKKTEAKAPIPKNCDGDCLSCNKEIYISCDKRINPEKYQDKKTGTYPSTEDDIRIPIDSQTNYK